MMENIDLDPANYLCSLSYLTSVEELFIMLGVLQAGNHAEHSHFRTHAKKRHLCQNQHRTDVLWTEQGTLQATFSSDICAKSYFVLAIYSIFQYLLQTQMDLAPQGRKSISILQAGQWWLRQNHLSRDIEYNVKTTSWTQMSWDSQLCCEWHCFFPPFRIAFFK